MKKIKTCTPAFRALFFCYSAGVDACTAFTEKIIFFFNHAHITLITTGELLFLYYNVYMKVTAQDVNCC